MKFEDLGLDSYILDQIKKDGFEEPTEIQAKCIPEIKKGRDIVGQSVTGSGKTVAFCIPVIEKTEPRGGIQALILTPTWVLLDEFILNWTSWISTVFGPWVE